MAAFLTIQNSFFHPGWVLPPKLVFTPERGKTSVTAWLVKVQITSSLIVASFLSMSGLRRDFTPSVASLARWNLGQVKNVIIWTNRERGSAKVYPAVSCLNGLEFDSSIDKLLLTTFNRYSYACMHIEILDTYTSHLSVLEFSVESQFVEHLLV